MEKYLSDLKLKASRCEFDNIKDSLIRDRFISGVQSPHLRRVLLKERNLTLSRTIEIAQLDELTQQRLKHFDGEQKEVNTLSEVRSNFKKSCDKCQNCGIPHQLEDTCPARGRQCNNCLRYNHFGRVCRSTPNRGRGTFTRAPGRFIRSSTRGSGRGRTNITGSHNIHELINNSREEEEEYFVIEELTPDNKQKDEIFVTLELNGVKTKLKVDTGAKCNVLNMNNAKEIASKVGALHVSKRNKVKLIAYGGDSFYTEGTIVMNCKYMKENYNLTFHIVDKPVRSLLGLPDSIALNLLTLSSDIHEISTTKHPELAAYSDIFSNELGKLPVTYKITVDPQVNPVIRSARRVPIAMKDRIKQELSSMVEKGVISKIEEPTEWVSNMVVAKKKNKDEIRLCIDPKDLNKAIKRPHHHLKTIEEVIAELPKAKFFSVLDAKNSFWQINLDENSSKLTTFATPWGRYKFNRLPYGIVAGSEVFQKSMDDLFIAQPCQIIVDDILIYGTDEIDHDNNLKLVLDRCREVNLKLNPSKCKLKVNKVSYVGHILSSEGVQADPEKIRAITELPKPEDVKALQRFLGMVNYLAKFIENHSTLTAPLRELLHKDIIYDWQPQHDSAFKIIKEAIAKPTILAYYDVKLEVTITCDASKDGLGAACLQNGKPIHYISRAMTSTETNYAQIEKELLAVVFACDKFKHYIYGRPVTIETDHQPLITIMRKPLNQAPTRLQKMLMKLQRYDCTLVYKKGKDMHIADMLSRAYLKFEETCDEEEYEIMSVCAVSEVRLKEIKEATLKDKTLQNLTRVVKNGWPVHTTELHKDVRQYMGSRDEIVIQEGILYKSDRIIIPTSLRPYYLKQLHRGHVGIESTKKRAKESVFWPTIMEEIEQLVATCTVCLSNKEHQQKEPMLPYPVPELPWQIVATDIFEWHSESYMVLVDSYSGWYEIDALNDLRSSTVINKLKRQFAIHGIPPNMYTDSGSQYTSTEFMKFCKEWGIQHKCSSPEYHQSNGLAERAVRSAKELLQKCFDDNSDFYLALLAQRNTIRSGELGSPAQRLLSRRTRNMVPVRSRLLKPKPIQKVPQTLKKIRLQKKQYYDKGTKPLKPLGPGDVVRIRTKKGHKVLGVVKRADDYPRSYIVEKGGKYYRRNRRHLLKTPENIPMPYYSLQPNSSKHNILDMHHQSENNLTNEHQHIQTTKKTSVANTANLPTTIDIPKINMDIQKTDIPAGNDDYAQNINSKISVASPVPVIVKTDIVPTAAYRRPVMHTATSSGRVVRPPKKFEDYV